MPCFFGAARNRRLETQPQIGRIAVQIGPVYEIGGALIQSRHMVTLTLEEAALWLKMHPHTLERKARAGLLPGAKPGRRWVFIEEDLAEWIRQHSREVQRSSTPDVERLLLVPTRSREADR